MRRSAVYLHKLEGRQQRAEHNACGSQLTGPLRSGPDAVNLPVSCHSLLRAQHLCVTAGVAAMQPLAYAHVTLTKDDARVYPVMPTCKSVAHLFNNQKIEDCQSCGLCVRTPSVRSM